MTDMLHTIPDWDSRGLLPPRLVADVSRSGRSPYGVSLVDVILHFGTTEARRNLLTGFLDYRAALHHGGLRDGFQWVNGSFVEDTSGHSQRDPSDIDIVTFYHLPEGQTQEQLAGAIPVLSDPSAAKERYRVDAYAIELNLEDASSIVRSAAYWYSVWAHDRDDQWKGYLEIDLSDSDDLAARTTLEESERWEMQG